MNRRPKVFVVNKSAHDFSPAEKYGDIIFLSEGPFPKLHLSHMYRVFSVELKNSHRDDFILQTGLTTMTTIACCIMTALHKRVNILLYDNNRYVARTLVFENNLRDIYVPLELEDTKKHKENKQKE